MTNGKKIKVIIITIIFAIILIDQITKVSIINNNNYKIGTISLNYEKNE